MTNKLVKWEIMMEKGSLTNPAGSLCKLHSFKTLHTNKYKILQRTKNIGHTYRMREDV